MTNDITQPDTVDDGMIVFASDIEENELKKKKKKKKKKDGLSVFLFELDNAN